MTMDERLEAFRRATTWLVPTGGCIVHAIPDCFEAFRVPMRPDLFEGRMVVAGVCRGDHEWGRAREWMDGLGNRVIWLRCSRHPQHPVYRIEGKPASGA